MCSSPHFATACTGINKPAFCQFMQRILINIEMTALIVNAIVPMQAENFQRFQDVVDGTLGVSRRVEVVDAKQPFALPRAGLKKTGQGRV